MKVSHLKNLAIGAAVTAVYVAAAKLGLSLAFFHSSVSPVWPPTGVAIAAVLLLGYRVSPALLLGAFLANLTLTPVGPVAGRAIALGNTLQAGAAAYLIHRLIGARSPFSRAQDVMTFVLVPGVFSPMISATIGNISLDLTGAAAWCNFGTLWL